jgi:uncharacterized protein with ATP-grasp and redox domains
MPSQSKIDPPPFLMTSEPGSFARKTIVERKPQIIQRVVADNDYPPETVRHLESFRDEIAHQPIQPLSEPAADVAAWNRQLASWSGKSWLEVPWYLAETFFYRRLLEAVAYFRPGPWKHRDPFGSQKQQQIELAVARLAAESDSLAGLDPALAFEALLHSALWGNRSDLSNLTVRLGAQGGLATRAERRNLLIDHTGQVRRYLTQVAPTAAGALRIDIICDNVGLDLLYDLVLADYLLEWAGVRRILLHLKSQPFFVSDAMPPDLEATLAQLQAASHPFLARLGSRLAASIAAGWLSYQSHPFWTTSLMFRQFPPDLRQELARSHLVILKGDVNYRRLLDDRHWPHTTPLEAIAAYFPAPFLVLRTLKGEIQVGLAPGLAEALATQDPHWLVNGQRGLVHFCRPATS